VARLGARTLPCLALVDNQLGGVGLNTIYSFVVIISSTSKYRKQLGGVGLNTIYSFIVIISSTNKYRKHKSSVLI